MPKRKAIPTKIKKLLWQEAVNMCAFEFCRNDDVDVLEIHHIIELANGGTDDFENLILVCSNCHNKITKGSISTVEVFKAKINLKNFKIKAKSNVIKFPTTSNSIQIERINNSGIVANNLEIKTQKKNIKLHPPNGTIGSDGDKRSYVKRLIERYQKFKKAEHGLTDFRYSVIYGAIKTKFKCKWDFIRLENFPALVLFLQKRIDKTRLGRNRKSKGQKNYSSFEEFLNHADSFQDLE